MYGVIGLLLKLDISLLFNFPILFHNLDPVLIQTNPADFSRDFGL